MENLENNVVSSDEVGSGEQQQGVQSPIPQQSPMPQQVGLTDPPSTDPNYQKSKAFSTANNYFLNRLSQAPAFRDPARYSQLEVQNISDRYLEADFGFNPYSESNEDFYAQRQGIFETLATIPFKLPAYTVTKIGSGVGFISGLLNPVNWYKASQGKENLISLAADNALAKYSDEAENYVRDVLLPTYQDTEDLQKGFWARAFTDANMYAEDLTDASAFLFSAWVPGLALSKLGIGARLINTAAKAGLATEAAGTVGNTIQYIGKGAKYFNNAAKYGSKIDKFNSWGLATASEAMFEAQGVKEKVYNSLEFSGLSEEEKKKRAGDAAFNTFLLNAGLLGATNVFELSMINKILGRTEGTASKVTGGLAFGDDLALRQAGKSMSDVTGFWNKAGVGAKNAFNYGLRISPAILREGYLEENGQLAIQRISERMGAQGKVSSIFDWQTWYNSDPENKGLFNQYISQTKDTLPFVGKDTEESRETAMNIGLGGLIGGVAQTIGNYKQDKRDKITSEKAVELYNLSQQNWLKFGDIYETKSVESTDANGNKITKNEVVFDGQGKPVIDQQKLAAIAMMSGINFEAVASTQDDTNESRKNFVRDHAFADFVRAHINAGMEDGLMEKLDRSAKASPEDLVKLGFVPGDNVQEQIDRYKALAQKIIDQNKLVNKDILFDNSSEDQARKYRLLELASNQAVLNSLIGDEQNRISRYRNQLHSDPDLSSVSDSLVDQLNELTHRIKAQEKYLEDLKDSSSSEDVRKTQIMASEELLENLKLKKEQVLKNNELTAKDLKTDNAGFYWYEKAEKNQLPFFKSYNRLTLYKGMLENQARMYGREWGQYADFFKGKQNFLDMFINEQLVAQINNAQNNPPASNSNVPPAGSNVPPNSGNTGQQAQPGSNTNPPKPNSPSPANVAPTDTLDNYLKYWYDKYAAATQGAIDRGERKGPILTYDEWKNNPLGQTKIRDYNKKNTPTPNTTSNQNTGTQPSSGNNTKSSSAQSNVVLRYKSKTGEDVVVIRNFEEKNGFATATFKITVNGKPIDDKRYNVFIYSAQSGKSVESFYQDYGIPAPQNLQSINSIFISKEEYDPDIKKTKVEGTVIFNENGQLKSEPLPPFVNNRVFTKGVTFNQQTGQQTGTQTNTQTGTTGQPAPTQTGTTQTGTPAGNTGQQTRQQTGQQAGGNDASDIEAKKAEITKLEKEREAILKQGNAGSIVDQIKADLSSLSGYQANTRTEATRKLINAWRKIYDLGPYTGSMEDSEAYNKAIKDVPGDADIAQMLRFNLNRLDVAKAELIRHAQELKGKESTQVDTSTIDSKIKQAKEELTTLQSSKASTVKATPVTEETTPQPEILLSGLNGGFQPVSYNAFDPKSIFSLAKEIYKKSSFAKLAEYKGKKYVVVGLSLKTARPTTTFGRDNYSFAAVEYTNNTPADILQTLEKKATENFKNIYRDFSSRDVINPIESVDPEIAALTGLLENGADVNDKDTEDKRDTDTPGPNDVKDYDNDSKSNLNAIWSDLELANSTYIADKRQIAPFNSLANATDLVEVIVNEVDGEKIVSYRRNGINPNYEFAIATPEFTGGQKVEFVVKTSGYENYPANRLDQTKYVKEDMFDNKDNVVDSAYDTVPIDVYANLNGKRKLIGTLHEPKWIGWKIGDSYPHIAVESEIPDQINKNRALRKQIIDAYNANHKATIEGFVSDKSIGVLKTTQDSDLLANRVNPKIAEGGKNNRHGFFGIVKNGMIYLDRKTLFSSDKLVTTKSLSPENAAKVEGMSVMLLPTPTGQFFPVFINLPNLTNDQSMFIIEAWKAFTKQTNNVELVDKVYNALGLKRNPEDKNFSYAILKDYIHQFYTVVDKDRITRTGTGSDMSNGQARLNINSKGHLELSIKANDKWYNYTGDKAIKKADELPVDYLSLMSNLKMSFSADGKQLEGLVGINNPSKTTILTIENGKLVSRDKTYNQHIMDNAYTRIEKGTESKNQFNDWVYFANPVIKLNVVSINNPKPDNNSKSEPAPVKTPDTVNTTAGSVGKRALSILDSLDLNQNQVNDQKKNCSNV